MAEPRDTQSGRDFLESPLADTVPDIAASTPALDGAGLEQLAEAEMGLVLPIDALLPDDEGSIVFDAIDTAMVDLQGSATVTETGVAPDGAQAAGQDVSGMGYASLDNGVTLYFPAEADFSVS